MTSSDFDTLSASKQLREAGMSEGVAEAVVSVFQHAAAMPDISHLATKADLDALSLATKADLAALAASSKTDVNALKAELEAFRVETQAEFRMVRLEIRASADAVRAEISDKFRQQTLALLAGMAFLITISTAAGRLIG